MSYITFKIPYKGYSYIFNSNTMSYKIYKAMFIVRVIVLSVRVIALSVMIFISVIQLRLDC